MTTPVRSDCPRLLLFGATGRMGRRVLEVLAEADAPVCTPVAAVSRAAPADLRGVPWFAADAPATWPEFDVVVDFSLPLAFDAILAACLDRGAALVTGTTGLEPAQQAARDAAVSRIPLLWASNFSLGVAVLDALAERAARALPGWSADIIETHHLHKRDAPSGTALTLAEALARGGAAPRLHSLRAGDAVGEHRVLFHGLGERIELLHQASDRAIFARGALHAAHWLATRPPGHYRMADVLGLAG
jgi:4-hydroxy-tetrahydrodipicolinate reductase